MYLVFIMAPLHVLTVLLIQGSFVFTHADDITDFNTVIENDEVIKRISDENWMDTLLNNEFNSPSASMMAYAADPKKPPEQQLEDIKGISSKIATTVQNEMINLLSYAMLGHENHAESKLNKRSVETPMDSAQLVMRLLKHIKSNNEHQNIAIEKLMSAKEIADKYNIEFEPEAEILNELELTSNKQEKELILKDASKDETEKTFTFIPLEKPQKHTHKHKPSGNHENSTYYEYTIYCPAEEILEDVYPPFEYIPEQISTVRPGVNRVPQTHSHCNSYYNHPCENQIQKPPVHHSPAPVSPRPNFFDITLPTPEFYPYCSMESVSTMILPFEEPVEREPEVVGEEYEETISSKVVIEDGDKPGSGTVNHVMTYTLAEKTHFKTPQDSLPQQLQYCFMLM